MIMVKSTPLEDPKANTKDRQCRYFKAKVLTDYKSDGVNDTVKGFLDKQSIIFTDKSTSYVDIADFIELHISGKSDKQTTKETLKWVHITISNAK